MLGKWVTLPLPIVRSVAALFVAHFMCGYSFLFDLDPLLLCWLLFNEVMLASSEWDVR